ncbi:hypothetical protein EI427_16610 [Flammeovirga pectinis]|uniref:3-octaprenyl-4-hydroxybenzoate carboxy-lyase-like N-terminal domain-containing protein n=1 Tax=Flammeovirga pectinis TaxID=2494373 RepID=A0A3Q9FQR0_9BACT|nr:UbiD family decarboxylase domain-containing protein [Flammeovirga pectinis]AZQ63787.1 hypothetical protein EI427_16610 [Flammeovirga pectinis]
MAKLDRSKIPTTYRDYLKTLKEMGELNEIDDEVDWYLEMGAIYRKANETLSPAVFFNKNKRMP